MTDKMSSEPEASESKVKTQNFGSRFSGPGEFSSGGNTGLGGADFSQYSDISGATGSGYDGENRFDHTTGFGPSVPSGFGLGGSSSGFGGHGAHGSGAGYGGGHPVHINGPTKAHFNGPSNINLGFPTKLNLPSVPNAHLNGPKKVKFKFPSINRFRGPSRYNLK